MNAKKGNNEPVELVLYSNKVSKEEWKQFFTTMLKWKVPGFDFLDFTLLFPFRACEMVFVKKANTIRPFVKGDLERIKNLGPLIFPFRASEDTKNREEIVSGGLPLGLYVLRDLNMFHFLVKEQVQQMNIRVFPLLGKLFGLGTLRKSGGGKRLVLLLNPEKFMEIDMEKNPSFYMELLDHPILKSVHMESSRPLFEVDGIKIGVENFDAFKHTLICGMSGTGKSKFIEMYVKALRFKYPDSRIVIIDPHNELSKTLKGEVIDFKGKHIEPLEIGRDKNPMTTQLIVQLMISVIGEQNKYSERILFYAVYLLAEVDKLTLENINLLLTDSAKRMEFASMAENDEIKRFFSVEFDDIYMHHFNTAVLPILNFISEYELYIGKKKNVVSLLDMVEQKEVTIVSFDPHFFGRRMIRFLAGAIIQQMYIFAITNKLKYPSLLLVDEFPVVETLVVKDILSETRKFNLHLCVSLQYLGQLRKEILDSILTNVYNVVSFRLSKSDAGYLGSLMDLKVEEFFKKRISPSELEEEKRNIFINLKVRECVVRMFDGEKYMIPMKVKTVDLEKWRDGTYNGEIKEKIGMREEDAPMPFIPYTGEQEGDGEKAEGKMSRKETELLAEGEERAGPKFEVYGGEGEAASREEGPAQKFTGQVPLPPDTGGLQQTISADESGSGEESGEGGDAEAHSGDNGEEEGGFQETVDEGGKEDKAAEEGAGEGADDAQEEGKEESAPEGKPEEGEEERGGGSPDIRKMLEEARKEREKKEGADDDEPGGEEGGEDAPDESGSGGRASGESLGNDTVEEESNNEGEDTVAEGEGTGDAPVTEVRGAEDEEAGEGSQPPSMREKQDAGEAAGGEGAEEGEEEGPDEPPDDSAAQDALKEKKARISALKEKLAKMRKMGRAKEGRKKPAKSRGKTRSGASARAKTGRREARPRKGKKKAHAKSPSRVKKAAGKKKAGKVKKPAKRGAKSRKKR